MHKKSRLKCDFETAYYPIILLKLKNITLGYTLPKNLTNKLYTQSIRVYLSGENLFSIDDFPGQDPEIGATPQYTTVRSFAFGANITF